MLLLLPWGAPRGTGLPLPTGTHWYPKYQPHPCCQMAEVGHPGPVQGFILTPNPPGCVVLHVVSLPNLQSAVILGWDGTQLSATPTRSSLGTSLVPSSPPSCSVPTCQHRAVLPEGPRLR